MTPKKQEKKSEEHKKEEKKVLSTEKNHSNKKPRQEKNIEETLDQKIIEEPTKKLVDYDNPDGQIIVTPKKTEEKKVPILEETVRRTRTTTPATEERKYGVRTDKKQEEQRQRITYMAGTEEKQYSPNQTNNTYFQKQEFTKTAEQEFSATRNYDSLAPKTGVIYETPTTTLETQKEKEWNTQTHHQTFGIETTEQERKRKRSLEGGLGY